MLGLLPVQIIRVYKLKPIKHVWLLRVYIVSMWGISTSW
jgi:hypothetical protein